MKRILRLGKIFSLQILLALMALTALSTSGCKFFGKQEEEVESKAPGELADGSTIVGTWSYSYSSTDADRNPQYALTTAMVFDPLGNVRLEFKWAHRGGASCTAYGVYRSVGPKDFMIFVQAVSSNQCAVSSQIRLSQVEVRAKSLRYKDDTTGYTYDYFKDNVQLGAPVGLWDFNSAGGEGGEGGIDYLFLDPHGYFLMQTTFEGSQYLMIGLYTIVNGALTLTFFTDMDPTQVLPDSSLHFVQFITDGNVLQLIGEDDQGEYVYTGTRL